MSRSGFEEVHGYLTSIGLPAGDSFWLFDPSGGDMALFTHDVDHPGPQHAWLLDQINAGSIDVLHSVGSYGERFNRGYRPNRAQIGRALEYLARTARVPRIWTNHGDRFNTQNIGGACPAPHHEGDDPGSESYCLDLLDAHGVRYFWLDRLITRDAAQLQRLTASERCRDGRTITSFVRFLSPAIDWSANAQNVDRQLRHEDVRLRADHQQDAIFYTHWGCHHDDRYAFTPASEVLPASSRRALERFMEWTRHEGVEVQRLQALLDGSATRPPLEEVDRIGRIVVLTEKDRADPFYYNQYHKHGISYFRRRIAGLAVTGTRALDAGCGVGQWSYALRERFEVVAGIEINPDALKYVSQLTQAMRWPDGPMFCRGSIEQLPYPDQSFDFIFCYGVLFVTAIRRALTEFRRVSAPAALTYVCLNGDGWYEYLCDERFRDRPSLEVLPFARPLWNALVGRAGGAAAFERWCVEELSREPLSFWSDHRALRTRCTALLNQRAESEIVATYSDRVMGLLGEITRAHLTGLMRQRSSIAARIARLLSGSRHQVVDEFPLAGIGATNRPFTSAEFKRLSQSCGLTMTASGPEAALSGGANAKPIYEGTFNGHDSVWECMLAAQ